MAKKTLNQSNRAKEYRVIPQYSYKGTACENVRQLEEVQQRDFQGTGDREHRVAGDMRTLLRHLEDGKVVYIGEMVVPSSRSNKQPSKFIVLRTVLSGSEAQWLVRHEDSESHCWEVNYSSEKNVFGAFRICSCDKVTAVK